MSPTKASKGKVKYIHFLKRIQNTLHRGICFSAAKHVHISIYTCLHLHICTYLKLPTPLVQIYLTIEHHLHQIYLDSSLSEYLSEVSPVKLSKDKRRKYFNFAIQNDNSLYLGVCFSPEKHALFNDISKDDDNTRIEIKRFRSSKNNEDIIVNSVKKTELNFERKDFQRKPFTVQQVINEFAIYDIVDISGLVYNLQQETTSQKEGALLRIRKGIMKD